MRQTMTTGVAASKTRVHNDAADPDRRDNRARPLSIAYNIQ